MKHNTYYKSLDTLHYNTLLSSQVFKIDSTNNLHIVELTPLRNRSKTIPLDLIGENPLTKKKLDTHLLLLTLVSTLASTIFFIYSFYAHQTWANAFGAVFLFSGFATLFFAYKNRVVSYTYQFSNTNTALFTLCEDFSKHEQVKIFVNGLNKHIISKNEQADLDDISYFSNKNTNDSKSLECTKHLEFLYNHGFVNDALYQRIDRKIHHRFFRQNGTVKAPTENIIYFPVKA